MKRSAGYSGKPLVTKLGIREGFRVSFVGEPNHYRSLLGALPAGVEVLGPRGTRLDFLHLFALEQPQLMSAIAKAKGRIKFDGMLWVSWPKQASRLRTDLNETVVRDIGLTNGLVDVKVAAIDDDWSGLKFVYRLRDRHEPDRKPPARRRRPVLRSRGPTHGLGHASQTRSGRSARRGSCAHKNRTGKFEDAPMKLLATILITSATLIACSVAPSTATFQTAMAATLTALPSSTPNPTSRPEPTPFPTKVLFTESYAIDLDPAAPASVVYADDLGVRSQLDFPVGASRAAVKVTLITELASSPDPDLVPTGHAFILLVSTAGQLDKSFVFERPVAITITYDEGALIQEQSLQFLWWSGEQWQDPGSTCAPTASAEWQPQTNTIRAVTCSAGAFALFMGS